MLHYHLVNAQFLALHFRVNFTYKICFCWNQVHLQFQHSNTHPGRKRWENRWGATQSCWHFAGYLLLPLSLQVLTEHTWLLLTTPNPHLQGHNLPFHSRAIFRAQQTAFRFHTSPWMNSRVTPPRAPKTAASVGRLKWEPSRKDFMLRLAEDQTN